MAVIPKDQRSLWKMQRGQLYIKFKPHPTDKHRQQLQCSNIQGQQALSNTVSESYLLAEFKAFGLEVDYSKIEEMSE